MRTSQRPSIPSGDPVDDVRAPRYGRTSLIAYLATFAAGLGWTSWLMAGSPGTPNQDEIAHVLIAKHAWHDPSLLLDAWGRPANTILFVLPARFGLTGARIGAIAISALSVLAVTAIAREVGVRRLYLIPLFLWFQPWFHNFGYLALTEIPFTLYLSCAILAALKGRYGWAALAFGLLPLARWEALALLPLVAIFLAVTRRWRPLVILATPVVLYLAASAVAGGNVNSVSDYLSMEAGAYGYGDLTHFFRTTGPIVGAPVLVLAALGLVGMRSRKVMAITAVWAAYFAVQVVTWYRGRGAGYAEFVLPVAPAFAILAALGTENLADLFGRARTRLLAAARWVVLAGAAASVLVLGFQSDRRPLDIEAKALKSAAIWLRERRFEAPRILSTHVWFQYYYGLPFPTKHEGLPDGGRTQPRGTIMVWDRHYSNRWGYHVEDLLDPTVWDRLATFGDGRAAIFRKT